MIQPAIPSLQSPVYGAISPNALLEALCMIRPHGLPLSTPCDAPRDMRDWMTENHLAPSSDLLAQVTSRFERLLDCQALGQIRGLAAALQLPPDAGGSFAHLLA